jgi:hypothetical protein
MQAVGAVLVFIGLLANVYGARLARGWLRARSG